MFARAESGSSCSSPLPLPTCTAAASGGLAVAPPSLPLVGLLSPALEDSAGTTALVVEKGGEGLLILHSYPQKRDRSGGAGLCSQASFPAHPPACQGEATGLVSAAASPAALSGSSSFSHNTSLLLGGEDLNPPPPFQGSFLIFMKTCGGVARQVCRRIPPL